MKHRWSKQANIPDGLVIGIRSSATVHDVGMIVAAYFAMQWPPVTIVAGLGDNRIIWAATLFVGGLFGLIGLFTRSIRLESTGCVLVVFAKLTWAAAVLQTNVSPFGTGTLAALLVAGAGGTMWRFFALLVGVFARVRE